MTKLEQNDKKIYGMKTEANAGRELYVNVEGKKYARFPVSTPLVVIDDSLEDFIEKYALPCYKKGDIFCISAKIISICRGFYVKDTDLKVSWLAKFLVRFVKKWPNDRGYAVPEKIQLAMNIVGFPRFMLALLIGGFMKLIGKPGYFYKVAGNNINAIDGFIPEMYSGPLQGYGFVIPKNPEKIADEIEEKYGMLTALLDGNNVDNHIIAMGKKLKENISKEKFSKILVGNPQGQEDGTPILIIREID